MKTSSSFYGPCLPGLVGHERNHYLTLTHWIESCKFEPSTNHDSMQEVLLTPTPKQAIRRSKAMRDKWRSDWQMIKPAVVVQGLFAYYVDNPMSYGLNTTKDELIAQIVASGSTDAVANALHQAVSAQLSAPRVVFLGHGNALPEEISKRLRSIQRKYQAQWTLVHWQGRHTSWEIHDCVIAERKPVVYVGEPSQRLVGEGLRHLTTECEHFVIFKKAEGDGIEHLVQSLKSLGKTVDVVTIKDTSKEASECSETAELQCALF